MSHGDVSFARSGSPSVQPRRRPRGREQSPVAATASSPQKMARLQRRNQGRAAGALREDTSSSTLSASSSSSAGREEEKPTVHVRGDVLGRYVCFVLLLSFLLTC